MMHSNNEEKRDYTPTIQRLLYDFPLYNYITRSNVNILVLGYSEISKKFIDFAFEMAQVSGYKLHITLASENKHAKSLYLTERPAFNKFFTVDNDEVKDDYGTLNFVHTTFENADNTVSELLLNEEKQKFAYIFIGTDKDDTNDTLAEKCLACRELLESQFVIICATENKKQEQESLHCFSREESIVEHKDYKMLKKIGFNCHLVWNCSKLLDLRKLQRQFLSKYNYTACISYCISLKYKLASIGVDMSDEAAHEKIDALMKSKKADDIGIVEQMIASEHRRWNVNMICRGYQTADPQKVVEGVETKAKKYHPCLVKGTGKRGLNDEWNARNHLKWDQFNEEELDALDPLDKVSVLLHHEYKTAADNVRKNISVLQFDIDVIEKKLKNYKQAQSAFAKYRICLAEIIDGNSSKTALYEHYYGELKKALTHLPSATKEEVRKRLDTICASFNYVIESERYIDYKQYDVELIEKIPFLLTYQTNLNIGIPIDVTNIGKAVNSAAFKIVASPLIINPSRITYICEYERGDLNSLIHIFEYALRSLDTHHSRAMVNVCLLSDATLRTNEIERIKATSKRIQSVDIIADEAAFTEYAQKRQLNIFEKTRTITSKTIEGFACYKSYYKYHQKDNRFETDCKEIKYIFFPQYLKISDVFEFKNSSEKYNLPDMKQDYEFFWRLYTGNNNNAPTERIWKTLCDLLGEHDKKVSLSEIGNIQGVCKRKKYLVNPKCTESIEKLCNRAKAANNNIDCQIEPYSNSFDKITVNAPGVMLKALDELLLTPEKLFDANYIDIRINKDTAQLVYDSLDSGIIRKELIEAYVEKRIVKIGELRNLLNSIRQKGYIRNLELNHPEGISFTYSTHHIKEVMTVSGRILELYVFYRMLEYGGFDDIATSVEIYWGDHSADNELDVVATAGYKVLFIECKLQTLLNQDYYNKLHRIDTDYGFNSIPVIVADTMEVNKHMEENQRLMNMGERVGIKTIYKRKDIQNIGEILSKLVK